MRKRLTASLSLVLASACAHQAPVPVNPNAVIVASPDRTAADRAMDPGRHPVEFLDFLAVPQGGHVEEIGAGGGYTTELLARAVGTDGIVYGQNSPQMLKKFAEKPWSERLVRTQMANVIRTDREFDDPVPAEAKPLDEVVFAFGYHDTVWLKVDRDHMNKAVFDALKPGGIYAVLDNSAKDGTGLADVQTVHRIDEKNVIDEVKKAGFKLISESNFLRNPSDARDWNDSPHEAGERRGTGDRFALRFQKPTLPTP